MADLVKREFLALELVTLTLQAMRKQPTETRSKWRLGKLNSRVNEQNKKWNISITRGDNPRLPMRL